MDYECSTCEMPASHHVSATELCKRIRALQVREASLIVQRNELNGLLIRLYNDLFVHHMGTAVADLKKKFREPNYN